MGPRVSNSNPGPESKPAPEQSVPAKQDSVQASASAMTVGGPVALEAEAPSVDLLKEFDPNSHRVAGQPVKHPYYEGVTTETALSLARSVKYGPLPKHEDLTPSVEDALEILREQNRQIGHQWITGRVSIEVLRMTLDPSFQPQP